MQQFVAATNGLLVVTDFAPLDVAKREDALDVRRSFCVSAPAGSGKTELLTQRVLALLATVDEPEELLAITFTRKAAGEMRNRISAALAAVAAGVEPAESHEVQRHKLAADALRRDGECGWNLVANPARLRIQTIDGLCMQLARQLPVLSQFGGGIRPIEDAAPLYEAAAASTLETVNTSHPRAADVETVLRSYQNDWQGLHRMLVDMLGRRDQWLDFLLVGVEEADARQLLQDTVGLLVKDHCKALRVQLADVAVDLCEIANFAGETLLECQPDSELIRLARLRGGELPADDDLATWRALANFWLTASTGTPGWRKTWQIGQGMPPKTHTERGERSAAYKEQCAHVSARLSQLPGLLEMFSEVRLLPEPGQDFQDWSVINALMNTLTLLVAQLLLEFQVRGEVDYNQLGIAARQALGDGDSPTDLSMQLDYQLRHILVDEFQDTSSGQYRLLEQLTRGWMEYNSENSNAPRTLFIVGDGMQSIYGFRAANVALFQRAREEGINGVTLSPIELSTNFRSRKTLVEWINGVFSTPVVEGLRAGNNFSPAVSPPDQDAQCRVTLLGFEGDSLRQQEAAAVCDIIEKAQQDADCRTLAILVRTRKHLQEILPVMSARGLQWRAVDIDPLAQRPAIVDLMTLYSALANPADEVAWLALLRATWCGLDGTDLLALDVLRGNPPHRTSIWSALNNLDHQSGISETGLARLNHVKAAIGNALSKLESVQLRLLLEETWLNLGGPGCVERIADLDDVECFFELVESMEAARGTLRPDALQRGVDRLFAQENFNATEVSGADKSALDVTLMTLHKSKGLEFDWVVMPGLDLGSGSDSRALLEWREYASPGGPTGLMLAPRSGDKAAADSQLYTWLWHDRKARARQEQRRLMYVGMTRAAERLFCLSGVMRNSDGSLREPPGDKLLKCIWDAFKSEADIAVNPSMEDIDIETDTAAVAYQGNILRRLDDSSVAATNVAEVARPRFCLQGLMPDFDQEARALGTAVHAMLEILAQQDELPERLSRESEWQLAAQLSLEQAGLSVARAEELSDTVLEQINTTLSDDTGRWILNSSHEISLVEYPVEVWVDGKAQLLIVDRIFVTAGERWIIDYKSSRPRSGENLEQFFERETVAYREQLSAYYDALNKLAPMASRVALYFPALGMLSEVSLSQA